jgi:hypothetical protein
MSAYVRGGECSEYSSSAESLPSKPQRPLPRPAPWLRASPAPALARLYSTRLMQIHRTHERDNRMLGPDSDEHDKVRDIRAETL